MTLQTALGAVLLFCPLLLSFRWKERGEGLAMILGLMLPFHLGVALLTQLLDIFTYPIVLILNVLFVLFLFWKFRGSRVLQKLIGNVAHADRILLFVLLVSGLCLWSVHFRYTGDVTVLGQAEPVQAQAMTYPYPYYSDEWYAVALIQDAMKTKSLPLQQPFAASPEPFANFEAAFHAFFAEILLLLGLDPLQHYTLLTVGWSMLIVMLLYLLLRSMKVRGFAGGIAALSALYITAGANLPGLWTLIPVMAGIACLLLTLLFLSQGKSHMTLLLTFVTLLFYPPLIVFLVPAFISTFLSQSEWRKQKKVLLQVIGLVLLAAVVVSMFFLLAIKDGTNFFSHVFFSAIFYDTYTAGAIPQYNPLHILPLPVIILALFGIPEGLRRHKWLLSALFTGLLFWMLYASVTWRLILEYQRAIIVTSLLLTVLSGLGIEEILQRMEKQTKRGVKGVKMMLPVLQIAVIVAFLSASSLYTEQSNWQKLTAIHQESGKVLMPSAPANIYLHQDDLSIFAKLSGKSFLSLPWKGTVIGTATDAVPLSTKPGTLTINPKLPYQFLHENCEGKAALAAKFHADFVYFPPFDCPYFEKQEVSDEGFHLYAYTAKQ